jgi:methionyl-tRNA synthetase
MGNSRKRYTITAALPYANGPLHIGHIAGAYLPADIFVRYLRLRGRDVAFICGSDEHGVAITLKAKMENTEPKEIIDKYHDLNKETFERFGIDFNIYHRTSEPIHHETSQDFFLKLYQKGEFVEKDSEQYYDPNYKQFLADRYIKGTCPHCSYNEAYGDQCEKCGTSLNPTDLIDPVSILSGEKPENRKTKHWYLPLDKYQPWLEEWLLKGKKDTWKSNVYGQSSSWLNAGLQPRAMTRDLDWGVDVPLPDTKGKKLYVWLDAPIGYISATKQWARDNGKNWEDYWKKHDNVEEDSCLIHFIGKDNIVFHCIIFPAILNAYGGYLLPENVPANEFLNLENDKISTSRNWAVWLHEYLDDFPGKQDVLRYVLCANMPETKDNDFTWKDFQNRNNNELVAILGNFVNRSLVLTKKYFDAKVPGRANLTTEDESALEEISLLKGVVEDNLENFRFREALKGAINLARLGNKYLADTEPWKLIKSDPERVKTILNISLQITANLTYLIEPFLPFTSEKLRGFINLEGVKWDDIGSKDLLVPGHLLNKPDLLFEKIEDETIEKQLNKLAESRKSSETDDMKVVEQKPPTSFDDFMKMDLRTATILEAEKVPKTDKLLKISLDTGIDKRTVVSGIAKYYDPAGIIGKQVILLANLEPRKIRGIESKGMILLAEDPEGKLVFVSPESKMMNGAIVK